MTASQHGPGDLKDDDNDVHEIPVWDLREHEDSRTCWCCPIEDLEQPGYFRHNVMGGTDSLPN